MERLELREDLSDGQRVYAHVVGAGEREVARGRTVGVRRWNTFDPVTTDRLTIRMDDPQGRLTSVTATGLSAKCDSLVR